MQLFNTLIHASFYKVRPLNDSRSIIFYWRNINTNMGWYFYFGAIEESFYSMRNGLRGKWYLNDRFFIEKLV